MFRTILFTVSVVISLYFFGCDESLPNNARMRDIFFANLKLVRNFVFDEQKGYRLNIYADIRNLFNAKNVKWIDSNGRIGGELSDPAAYYDYRRVRVGFIVDF